MRLDCGKIMAYRLGLGDFCQALPESAQDLPESAQAVESCAHPAIRRGGLIGEFASGEFVDLEFVFSEFV